MQAFWWFKEDAIAGMARPGFNSVKWFDLPFDEAVLLGWVGQYSAGKVELESFRRHLRDYVPKIFTFHHLNEESGARALRVFEEKSEILNSLERLNQRTRVLETFAIVGDSLHLELSEGQLRREAEALKQRGIRRIVSLTERHHGQEVLAEYFALHHIGIEDLGAPGLAQVHDLVEVIHQSRARNEKLAVHCLAGIGRTSTMLWGAHLLMGEGMESLRARLARQNPAFQLSGSQSKFIHALRDSLHLNGEEKNHE